MALPAPGPAMWSRSCVSHRGFSSTGAGERRGGRGWWCGACILAAGVPGRSRGCHGREVWGLLGREVVVLTGVGVKRLPGRCGWVPCPEPPKKSHPPWRCHAVISWRLLEPSGELRDERRTSRDGRQRLELSGGMQ